MQPMSHMTQVQVFRLNCCLIFRPNKSLLPQLMRTSKNRVCIFVHCYIGYCELEILIKRQIKQLGPVMSDSMKLE